MFKMFRERIALSRSPRVRGVTLYHGSYKCVRRPEMGHNPENSTRDFGDGFYLADNKISAVLWANRKSRNALGYVSEYTFDITGASSDGMVWNIARPNREWAEFVCNNRLGSQQTAPPIVIGPTADNRMEEMLDRYYVGQLSYDDMVQLLRPQRNMDGSIMV